jgi:ribosome-binding factor A
MPREFTRSDRIAAQFQRELAELIRTDIKDPRLGMVTVSDVEATRDLSLVKIYVSFLGAAETPRHCVKILAEFAPLLRHALARRVRMRVLPELRFVHDESIERGMRMEKLLSDLHIGDAATERAEEDGETDPSS